jgi:hypothetical protein
VRPARESPAGVKLFFARGKTKHTHRVLPTHTVGREPECHPMQIRRTESAAWTQHPYGVLASWPGMLRKAGNHD